MKLDLILIDVDTQRDFLAANASLPVANAATAIPALRRIMSWARVTRVPIISTLDTHRDNEIRQGVPLHCLEGTPGQRKLDFTLMRHRRLVETDTTLALPLDLLDTYHQVIFRKRGRDFFANPKADRLLTDLDAAEIIVCGVGLECCVRSLVLGLMARHKRVALIPEACGTWNSVDGELAARLMEAKGVRMLSVDELVASNGVSDNGRHRQPGPNAQAPKNNGRVAQPKR